MSEPALATSHLIVYVRDTDASLAFWCGGMGGALERDEELAAPALDAMLGRRGVRIRDAFVRIGGIRLHTVETLDVPYAGPARPPRAPGIDGLSFAVDDLETARARCLERGLAPTPIYGFEKTDPPCRMFFLDDPDGIRVEMIEYR